MPKSNDTKVLITFLAKLLDNDWKKDYTFINQEDVSDMGLDSLHILATSLYKANSTNLGDFVFAT